MITFSVWPAFFCNFCEIQKKCKVKKNLKIHNLNKDQSKFLRKKMCYKKTNCNYIHFLL